ncbi:hypothetical protein RS030_4594 [Cryptosporidium xiaoi]|uniref:Uncharacterized protein n=1 Tax=Cryptosporidium xiaoi TaxID=659607 RepID=A0AAV9XW15_9CRYT
MFKENILSKDNTIEDSNEIETYEFNKNSLCLIDEEESDDYEKENKNNPVNDNYISTSIHNFINLNKINQSCLRNNKSSLNNSKKVVRFTDLPPEIYEYENYGYTNGKLLHNYFNVKNGLFFREDKDGELEDFKNEDDKMENSEIIERNDDDNSENCSKLLPILSRNKIYEMEKEIMSEFGDSIDFANVCRTREIISIDGKYINKKHKSGLDSLPNNQKNNDIDYSDCGTEYNKLGTDLDTLNTTNKEFELEKDVEYYDKKDSYNKNYITLEELSIEISKIPITQTDDEAYIKRGNIDEDPSYMNLQSTTESLNFYEE